MSESKVLTLEDHKKEYVMIQQRIAQFNQELQKLTVARERKFGMIQILEDQEKKKQALEAAVEKVIEPIDEV